jgi:hypothetical protein
MEDDNGLLTIHPNGGRAGGFPTRILLPTSLEYSALVSAAGPVGADA